MNDDLIKNIKIAASRGHAPAAIAKLLGADLAQVEDVLGVRDDPEPVDAVVTVPDDVDLADLAKLGTDGLYQLAMDALTNPQAYKPNEALAIYGQCLDRGIGKAAQMLTVEGNQRITHALDDDDKAIIEAYVQAKQMDTAAVLDVVAEVDPTP